MKPKEAFLGQPIRSLQTMLRVLAENDDASKPLIPDGIYGPDTMEAVRIFQRLHRLPITGVTDLLTWEAVWKLINWPWWRSPCRRRSRSF